MNRCNPCRCPHKRFTEITNRCDPCKCLPKITQPVKSHYFYVEKGPSPINSKSKPINSVPERQPRSRPSSASSVKPRSRPSSASTVPSGGSKRSLGGTSKVTSSDSKILKKKTPIKTKISSPLKNREERKSKIDEESVKQLKEDLKTIKDQLSILTKSRNEALDVTNELEKRYTNLLNKSESQEKEIEELKRINRSLQEALNRQTSSSSSSNIELKNAKVCLQQYEQQLTALYKELMTTSKAMEESRDKVCQCIKEKQNEYNEMVHSNKELSKVVEEKNSKYENLLEQFQTAKNKEVKYRKQNEELLQTIEELENQLSEATMELEASREETAITAKQLQEEMMDKTKCYTYELQLKAKEIEELNEAVEHLRKHICQCKTTNNKQMEAKYEQLLQKYNCAMEQLKFYERNCKCSK